MAKIKNMGTATMSFNEGVIVKGTAGSDEHALIVSGSMIVSGSVYSKHRWTKIDKISKTGNFNSFYVKVEGTGNQSPVGSTTWWIPPADGRLISAHLRTNNAFGSTKITLVTVNEGINPAARDDDNNESADHNDIELQIVNCAIAKKNYAFNFTAGASYTKDQAILLRVSGSAIPGDGMLTTVWEYDFTG